MSEALIMQRAGTAELLRLLPSVFKLRIGLAIMFCALAGIAVTPGERLAIWQVIVLGLAVLLSSASAGAFNQYVERDLDARMRRTRNRPFVTGQLGAHPAWPIAIVALLVLAVMAAALATNAVAALHVFLGAFTYGIVYTVWLKRRTWLNIVVGGLAGSFAVLAGAAAVDPALGLVPLLMAAVLFLWTPPHFWSLAYAFRDQYRDAAVPMLPAVVSDATCAKAILAHTLALVAVSLVPAAFGLGMVYLIGAVAGGGLFIHTSVRFVREPSRVNAMRNFHASLIQLVAVLSGAMLDAAFGAL